ERVADGLELLRAQLDQRLALAHQLECLVQRSLAGVQAADDLLDPRRRRLIALRRLAHRWTLMGGGSWPGRCPWRSAVAPRLRRERARRSTAVRRLET